MDNKPSNIDPKLSMLDAFLASIATNCITTESTATNEIEQSMNEVDDIESILTLFPNLTVEMVERKIHEIQNQEDNIKKRPMLKTPEVETNTNNIDDTLAIGNKKEKNKKSKKKSKIETPLVLSHLGKEIMKKASKATEAINQWRSSPDKIDEADALKDALSRNKDVAKGQLKVSVDRDVRVHLVGCIAKVWKGKHSGCSGEITNVTKNGNVMIEQDDEDSEEPNVLTGIRYSHMALVLDQRGKEEQQKVLKHGKKSGGKSIKFVESLDDVKCEPWIESKKIFSEDTFAMRGKKKFKVYLGSMKDEEDIESVQERCSDWARHHYNEWYNNFDGSPTKEDLHKELERLGVREIHSSIP